MEQILVVINNSTLQIWRVTGFYRAYGNNEAL